jgi:hypothetical protein
MGTLIIRHKVNPAARAAVTLVAARLRWHAYLVTDPLPRS